MKDIKLPPLYFNDLVKLDNLLLFMKKNKSTYVNIYSFCKDKWGENRMLYLFFAEYLKNNSFTLVSNENNAREYAWRQMIAPNGLAIESFKKEYVRLHRRKNKTLERIASLVNFFI
jgi:hypothetical protein